MYFCKNRFIEYEYFLFFIGVNHFGHYYLTKLLLPALRRGHEESGKVVRIVNVASDAHQMSSIYWYTNFFSLFFPPFLC